MQSLQVISIALRALTVNKMRSLLTMLGIIIGITTSVVLITAGQGVEKYIHDLFAGVGTNVLFVFPGQIDDSNNPSEEPRIGELTLSDARALANPLNVPDVAAIAIEANARGTVVRGNEALQIDLLAISPEHETIRGWNAQIGEFFTQEDMDGRRRVALLGHETYQRLYQPNEDPVGTQIRLEGVVFTVKGVMKQIGFSQFGNRDNSVFVPYTTAQERILKWKTVNGDYKVSQILASVINEDRMAQAQIEIEELLRERHRIDYFEEDDFSVVNQADFISVFGDLTTVVTIFLGSIAAISLLVGGIGIMNIMLVSVAERTREIGLRKAIGARRWDILQQFLVEAVFLSVLGGVFGIALGGVLTSVAGDQFDAVDLSVRPGTAFGVVLFCVSTGIVFGFWPAWRASRLKPTEALRSD